ncbi:reverse transcriptase domain-containing protein, partial [Tanacetum coccineum]
MPTWCHMFNSTLTGNASVWFDKLLKESIDSYEDLRAAFRENYLQQTKHIKDLVEIHHIKQRNGESTEDFMERYKAEVLDLEGAPECMKISRFMHRITHPELIERLYEKIPRSMDDMYRVTTSFLHSTDECMKLRKQIDEMIKSGEEDGTEGPMIIEAEIGGHSVHQIYVDGGASLKVLYEHCFVRLQPEIRSQMIPATRSLVGFSGETMLTFPDKGGTVKIRSSRVISMECAMISGPNTQHPVTSQVLEEKIKVAIHPEYP